MAYWMFLRPPLPLSVTQSAGDGVGEKDLPVGPGGYAPSPPVDETPWSLCPSLPPSIFQPRPVNCISHSDLPPLSPERSPRSSFLSCATTKTKVVFHLFKLGTRAAISSRAHFSITTHNTRGKCFFPRGPEVSPLRAGPMTSHASAFSSTS